MVDIDKFMEKVLECTSRLNEVEKQTSINTASINNINKELKNIKSILKSIDTSNIEKTENNLKNVYTSIDKIESDIISINKKFNNLVNEHNLI